MAKANEIKRGMAVSYNNKLLLVKDIDIQAPSARGASTLYKMRFTDIRTGQKVEERFKGDDMVDTINLTRRAVSFLILMVMSMSLWTMKITHLIPSKRSN